MSSNVKVIGRKNYGADLDYPSEKDWDRFDLIPKCGIKTGKGEMITTQRNSYSRLMALQRMGIVKDYERIREKCGVGKLILFDYNKVELANMNWLFFTARSQLLSWDCRKWQLLRVLRKPDVEIRTHNCNVTTETETETIQTGGSVPGTPVDLVLNGHKCCVNAVSGHI